MSAEPSISIETRKWIEELKKRGINEFEFKDLPEDLKIIRKIYRCSIAGLIKKIGRRKGHNIWKIL